MYVYEAEERTYYSFNISQTVKSKGYTYLTHNSGNINHLKPHKWSPLRITQTQSTLPLPISLRFISAYNRPYGDYLTPLIHQATRPSHTAVFHNRRAAARYRALASIIPGRERFSWNLSFYFS